MDLASLSRSPSSLPNSANSGALFNFEICISTLISSRRITSFGPERRPGADRFTSRSFRSASSMRSCSSAVTAGAGVGCSLLVFYYLCLSRANLKHCLGLSPLTR